jgi:hypothetical protein
LSVLLKLALVGAGGLCALGFAISVGMFNERLRQMAESELTASLGRDVRIGQMDGNPLFWLELRQVVIESPVERSETGESNWTAGPDTIDSIRLVYQPHRVLFGSVDFDTLRVVSPRVRFAGHSKSEGEGAGEESSFSITVDHFEVEDGKARIDTESAGVDVRELDVVAGFRAGTSGFAVSLRKVRTIVFDPPLQVSNLSGVGLLEDGRVELRDIRLQTALSGFRVNGIIDDLYLPVFDLSVTADSVSLEEMQILIPGTYPEGKASAAGTLIGPISELRANFDIRFDKMAAAVSGVFDFTAERVRYTFDLRATDIDLMEILPESGLDARFNLDLSGSGSGFDEDTELKFEAKLGHGTLMGTRVDAASLSARVENQNLHGRLEATGEAGRFVALIDVDGRAQIPLYTLKLQLDNLNLSAIPNTPDIDTDFTGEVTLTRVGAEAWKGLLRMRHARMGEQRLSDLELAGEFSAGGFRIGHFGARARWDDLDLGWVTGSGSGTLGRFWVGGENPSYDVTILTEQLSLSKLLSDDRVEGWVATSTHFTGTGIVPDSVDMISSTTIRIDSLLGWDSMIGTIDLRQKGRWMDIDGGFVSDMLQVDLTGESHVDGALNLKVTGTTAHTDSLTRLLGIPLRGDGFDLSGSLAGTWRDPVLSIDTLRSDSIFVFDVPLRGVSVRARWPELVAGGLSVRVDSVEWGRHVIHDVFLDAGMEAEDFLFFVGTASEDENHLHLWGRSGERTPKEGSSRGPYREIRLDTLAVRAGPVALRNQGACLFRYDSATGLSVDRFRMEGTSGFIEAIPTGSGGPLSVRLERVDLRPWAFLMGATGSFAGVLNGRLEMQRDLRHPIVSGGFELTDGNLGGFKFERLAAEGAFSDSVATLRVNMRQSGDSAALFDSRLPLRRSPGADGSWLWNGPVEMKLVTAGVDLAFLEQMLPSVRQAGGVLSADVQVSG